MWAWVQEKQPDKCCHICVLGRAAPLAACTEVTKDVAQGEPQA